jgi:hypothetical protein
MSKLFKTRPNKTAAQPLVVSVPEPSAAVVIEPTRITDEQLLADCVRCNDALRPVYARCQELFGHQQPVLTCEELYPRSAARFWHATDVLDSLLASRTYTQDQVSEKLAKQVDALKECVSAMARGKVEQLTDEEVFAVNEKQAIILEGSINKNERLAFVRALQLLVD